MTYIQIVGNVLKIQRKGCWFCCLNANDSKPNFSPHHYGKVMILAWQLTAARLTLAPTDSLTRGAQQKVKMPGRKYSCYRPNDPHHN